MKLKNLVLLIWSALLFLSMPAQAQEACRAIFLTKEVKETASRKRARVAAEPAKAGISVTSNYRAPYQDLLIAKNLGDLGISYSLWGQPLLPTATYGKAIEVLKKSLDIDSIQKAHKLLSGGDAKLNFRGTSDAKVIGDYSFKDFFALTPEEVRTVDANPFLKFVPSKEVTKHGILNKELAVGDILFPNVETVSGFKSMLSKSTLELAKTAKSETDISLANQAILADLLSWTLTTAENQVKAGKEPAHIILAMLEWRVKSLGLYYESTFTTKGTYLESALGKINENRSAELAEAIVDTFAAANKLSTKDIQRAYRPSVKDPVSDWTTYMKDALDNTAISKIESLQVELKDLAKNMGQDQALAFETYYMTRLMTGEKSSTTADVILKDFKRYYSVHYNKDIPESVRALLIPMDFIKNFPEVPGSFHKYYEQYYLNERMLFRGVSNTTKLTDNSVATYFKDFKGRFASEVARSVFQNRTQFAKLSMLRFNIDLINGRAVEIAAQHASKHMGYEAPNSAKTYFVSATDLNTIAFRFAMDKGYVDRSSSNALGNTHMVFEFLTPKHGMVEFGHLKMTFPTWKNYFPRQRETSIAAGLDPNSLMRIYILAPHPEGAKIPTSGPEKHGKIVKVFERDPESPDKIDVKLLKEDGEWEVIQTFDLPGVKD